MTPIPLFSSEIVNSCEKLAASVNRVIQSSWYVLGSEVSKFEQEFAGYNGSKYSLSLANGTDSLELSLKAFDVIAGDTVFVAGNAGFYGSTAIQSIGAHSVCIEVDLETRNMSPKALGSALSAASKKPKAVIVTHLYGQMANIEEIVKICKPLNIPVIEDCAQAHGAKRGGKRVGSFADIGSFSFYPTKNLGAIGDGGAITTDNEALFNKVKQLRTYGWGQKYHVAVSGGRNSRLDEIQAAVLRDKLPLLDECNQQRRNIAKKYNEAFKNLKLRIPNSVGEDYVAHLYVLQISNRNEFRTYLEKQGVMTDVHYPVPDHLQAGYFHKESLSKLPITEELCNSVVTLPCFPGMTDEQVHRVIKSVVAYFG